MGSASMLRLDLHIHTSFSRDGYIRVSDLDRLCAQRKIDQVAICDHDEIAGALRAAELCKEVQIIVGEEIATVEGEIIGLFLEKHIPPGMDMNDTIGAIKTQGGLVYLEHPYGYLHRSSYLDLACLESLWDHIDIVEVYNARNLMPSMNRKALALATERNKPMAVGSDAHFPVEIGRTYQVVPPWEGKNGLVKALQRSNRICRPFTPFHRLLCLAYKAMFSKPEAE